MRKLLMAFIGLVMGTAAANATAITGTYTISDSNSTNAALITKVYASPFTFNLNIGDVFSTILINFQDSATVTNSLVTANFTFTAPSAGSGSPTGSDTFAHITGNTYNDTFSPLSSSFVDFGSAGILGISFGAATTGDFTKCPPAPSCSGLNVPVTFTLNAPSTTTRVPEPATIALFGAGLLALSFLGWKRRRTV